LSIDNAYIIKILRLIASYIVSVEQNKVALVEKGRFSFGVLRQYHVELEGEELANERAMDELKADLPLIEFVRQEAIHIASDN
jgi:hypothetical protein